MQFFKQVRNRWTIQRQFQTIRPKYAYIKIETKNKEIEKLFNNNRKEDDLCEEKKKMIDRQTLYKTITKYWMKKDIEKANEIFQELDKESILIDDLALSYLIEGNLEEGKWHQAYNYLIYAHLTQQVLDLEIYSYVATLTPQHHISYLHTLFHFIIQDFTIPSRLFSLIYKQAYKAKYFPLLDQMDSYMEQHQIEVDMSEQEQEEQEEEEEEGKLKVWKIKPSQELIRSIRKVIHQNYHNSNRGKHNNSHYSSDEQDNQSGSDTEQ